MGGKSRILIIGGTGYIGKFMVEASVNADHPTFVLVRDSTLSATASSKTNLIHSFRNSGVSFLIRFFPSEFGNDVDRVHAVEPAKSTFGHKAQFRRVVEASGVPYTYVSSNLFAGIFIRSLAQLDATSPPRDRVIILGDGNTKAVYNREEDIATYTIKAVDDSRTLNKFLYVRPPANCISMNDLTTLWENKIGKKT